MNLPHKEPILFANKLLKKDTFNAKVKCIFPFIPTLGMGIEACAQSCSALAEKEIEGFLAGANDVELLKQMDKKIFIAKVEKIYKIDKMELFYFELEDYLKGKVAIYVK